MKILLVDDDRTMRSILKTLLELDKHTVVSWDARPDSDIVELARLEKPDLIILDVYLRDISGLDIVRSLRSDPAFTDVKIVMSSGMALNDECKQAGADEFLLKPYIPDDLFAIIKKVG